MRFIAINYNFYLFYTLGIRYKIFFFFEKKVPLLEKTTNLEYGNRVNFFSSVL